MEKLIGRLYAGDYESTALKFNGSPIYEVNYGDDKKLRYWNDSNSERINHDDVCEKIAQVIEDEGIDIQDNNVMDGRNTITFEIFDEDTF